MRAAIALGSNLGDRMGFLNAARAQLFSLHDGSGPFLCSRIYETPPVDCPEGSPSFLNAVIELSTAMPPLDLLGVLQGWEEAAGRPREHDFHGPRTLDLDLLYFGTVRLSLPELTLPHPAIGKRMFVLRPLADVAPERILPGAGMSVAEMKEACEKADPSSHLVRFVGYFG